MPSPGSARLPELVVEGTEPPCVSRGRAARILPPSLLPTALLHLCQGQEGEDPESGPSRDESLCWGWEQAPVWKAGCLLPQLCCL